MFPAGVNTTYKRTDFATWRNVNRLKRELVSSTDNCLKSTIFDLKIASIQTASWSDSHERGSETKAPHNHHLFLLLARSSMLVLLLKCQPPLKQLPRGVPSCPDRGIFSSLCPRISMSHLSIVPFILPQQGIGPARALIQLFNVLMTLGRPDTEGTNWTALVVKIHVSW